MFAVTVCDGVVKPEWSFGCCSPHGADMEYVDQRRDAIFWGADNKPTEDEPKPFPYIVPELSALGPASHVA
jgi:hypothetical protein